MSMDQRARVGRLSTVMNVVPYSQSLMSVWTHGNVHTVALNTG